MEDMFPLVLGLLVCLVLAVVVLGLGAVPARREGRDLLTERGERVVVRVKDQADAAKERAGQAGHRAGGLVPGRKGAA